MSWKPALVWGIELLAFELGGYLDHRTWVNGPLAAVIFASGCFLAYAAWSPEGYETISQVYAHVRANLGPVTGGFILWVIGSALYFHLVLGVWNNLQEKLTP